MGPLQCPEQQSASWLQPSAVMKQHVWEEGSHSSWIGPQDPCPLPVQWLPGSEPQPRPMTNKFNQSSPVKTLRTIFKSYTDLMPVGTLPRAQNFGVLVS
jgi:hypothetical protein